MKAVKAHLQETNPERVEAFEKGAAAFAKKIIGNFKDYEFYVGESMNPDGMVALLVSIGLCWDTDAWRSYWSLCGSWLVARTSTVRSGPACSDSQLLSS